MKTPAADQIQKDFDPKRKIVWPGFFMEAVQSTGETASRLVTKSRKERLQGDDQNER
jgi:hypothetical protein